VLAVDPDLAYMVVAHVALHKCDVCTFLGRVNGSFKAFCRGWRFYLTAHRINYSRPPRPRPRSFDLLGFLLQNLW
jgi:hypothetical protein